MPSLVKIFVECGRDLPVMDRNTVSAESSTGTYVSYCLTSLSNSSPLSYPSFLTSIYYVTCMMLNIDAYVEVRLNDVVQRTATCRKSLNPVWKEEFRFEASLSNFLFCKINH